ncbi:hybrid sensor histidine kinase/response regulator [Trichlorobacter ammonificans]|uniref:histidine kinase n=1 Tax=Trichlorobacter ammonificans TaxID=2916410 RepID=A0ABM9D4N2_9BACT|nr:response regulator [Trichlorobacter ammonificans]CAH2030223.1 Chemotaxis regulator - transmits chemoreceptor signals to flagelllar motor components CheY [Trichlorobacter ammonificans]
MAALSGGGRPEQVEAATTIVVIDDEPAICHLVSLLLAERGYRVTTAATAAEGLAAARTYQPDLVLMDYLLPDLDGIALLQELKATVPDCAVIICTGRGSEEIAVQLIKNGAAEYLLKPFNPRTFGDRIDAVRRLRSIELANRALQQERERLLLEIESWNRELQSRVREKSEALQRAQAEIAQTEKLAALGYLAAGMAHEIRNPLNSIALFTQLLTQGASEAETQEFLDKILKEVDRIDGIIRRLVEAANRRRSAAQVVLVDQVVREALAIFKPQVEARQITVDFRCPTPLPSIKADPTELEQIFTNLFQNALEEMGDGGRLAIGLSGSGSGIEIRVADSGGGIRPEDREAIFKPFYSTKSRGTGIGLPVAQRIARLYRGDLSVEHSSPAGTTFLVTLPVTC